MSISLNFHRKWALAIPAVIFGCYALGALFGQDQVEDGDWVAITLVALVGMPFVIFVLAVGALVAIFTRSSSSAPAMRLADRFLPAIVLAISIVIMSGIIQHDARKSKLAFAAAHRSDFSGPPPTAVVYSEGIPDGGEAIVRLPDRNPERLPQSVMLDLTGERIKRCTRLDDEFWACHFD
ncbi:hypothetical protein [Alteriqipengyuania lutimaris]|uniref:Uncharacterized protein n=1 Tax=Alteriqipengyuania lutimaris TaxID=1538146 RepID=A0A395LMK3_9SPHN|nr:hypothetical protein [Alteriqipengyuania lutimaris]MBB3032647.1 flagellar biosynthesis protein FliQ [Alteriqipengyuania lutimaris]RDS78238.1 hypothetical protein DL238_11895 [Alteriqipengyuania lutimaris]